MKKQEFKSLIAEAVTPVVRRIIRQEIKRAFKDVLGEMNPDTSAPTPTVNLPIAESKNGKFSMADIFSETKPFEAEAGATAPVGHSISLSGNESNEFQNKELINETIDSNESMTDKQKSVAKAMTRDYSGLMKHMNEKRGASRRQAHR